MHGRGQSAIRRLTAENESLQAGARRLQNTIDSGLRQIQNLTDNNSALKDANRELTSANGDLKKINKDLQNEIIQTKDRFRDIFEGDLAPKNVREEIYNGLKSKIDAGKLDYDISTPPITGKGETPVFEDAVSLPAFRATTNRATMSKLDIPEIASDGRFDYTLPLSSEMNVTKIQSKEFTPVQNQLTNVTETYADSVQWNNDKIARDVLQNFYDGHGQTLDGVQLIFTPVENGRYKVKILGNSTYSADKAIYIGESTKRNDAKAAGNYGEGLKMSVLKLLKDAGAQDVKIASDNWKVTYTLANSELSDKKVLAYSLDKVPKLDGNYIEFETSDKNLLETFRKSINRFYHSHNEHFKCPDFENDIIGIKKVPKGEKGGIYIAGQRFEFAGDYDGLQDFVVFLKEKPPVDILDPSRDRISLGKDQLNKIASWLAKDERMSADDKIKMLQSLESCWDSKNLLNETPMDGFVESFLLSSRFSENPFHIKFPSKYVAYSNASNELVQDLRMNGYRVCKSNFNSLGMSTIKDLMGDARAHDVVMPNEVQTKKILLLKEALNNLGLTLKDNHFTADELNTKIYLFDNKSAKDSKLYSNAMAEAITDKGESKGFWIDKTYLDNASFADVLETALHELSHKVGGDESMEFSYKLTSVNQDAIKQISNDPKSRNELQALNRIWDELSQNNIVS